VGAQVAEGRAAPDPVPAGFRVRGQATGAAAAAAMIRRARAHALLLVGPAGIGKTTLALDVAALLLCAAEPDDRPCRDCRGCRMVASGNHPDVHRLAPEGPGGQIRIGSRSDAEPGTVRRLVADLALLPVEGGARVAIVEHADRLNEDAQSALLKTLEEPPARTWLVLCADEEERLLPTVRSRCARVRLGPVAVREIEALLGDLGAADAPTANRLGRLAGGRPGVALGWARAPEAITVRGEIARTLLDLLGASRATRLTSIRRLLASAGEAATALARDKATSAPTPLRRGRRAIPPPAPVSTPESDAQAGTDNEEAAITGPRRIPPAERRRAALLLVDVWRDVTRDLTLVGLGDSTRLRDPGLLDDLKAASGSLPAGDAGRFLGRLDAAGELIESNVNPELVADGLVLAWPRSPAAAATREPTPSSR
jgi:DNA polymerase-3 subunit delta'